MSRHVAAQAAFARHAYRYDTRRLRAELRAKGHAMGRYALRSWVHHQDLYGLSTFSAPHHCGRPGGYFGRKPAVWPASAHRSRLGVGWRHHVLAAARRALVLPDYLARYLFSAGRGLAPSRADARRTRAAGSGAGLDPAPARARAPRPRRTRQLIHQRHLPSLHPPSRDRIQLQPAGQHLRQRPTRYDPSRSRLEYSKLNCCPTVLPLLRLKKPA